MKKIRVLIVDDHTLFRQGLRAMLEFEKGIKIIGEASSGSEAIQKCEKLLPDIVLMDLEMPELNGIEAVKAIRQSCPNVGIIMLTMYGDDGHLFEAIKAGANGYVLKESSIDKLLAHIKAVANGESILNSSIARRVLEEFVKLAQEYYSQKEAYKKLTAREIEILELLADGKANKQIARKLFISEKTVKNHTANIYSKLHCNDRTQAVLEGLRLGLIQVEQ